jgi:tyrosyl-tRNA synthetase
VIDKATGKKFGKSEGNAVWLDATKTSPFVFYQFWFNVSDESVIDYLRLFTFRPLAEIDQIKSEHELNPAARLAQKALASAVTAYVHSAEAARTAERVSDSLFGVMPLASLTPEEVEVLKANAPLCKIKSETPLVEVLVQTGLASSKREAREFVDAGAILVAGEKPASKDALVVGDTGKVILVKRGKRHVSLVEIE